ncbi:hypothetical protein [Thermoflavimicrobium dichotomicum]|uniref:DoxX protein n=1 Tax=Thermoflavimicrobium dichotomicum TaxID=46223 RepID=A0A1I3TXS3_9BACL|nr:hypothetical protein [Thermoflavimicrobium dichotomicum]SFJ75442.1 hypothetical protein SAMN05421852_12029 [Thermoflavimicrobium dichotomicum]
MTQNRLIRVLKQSVPATMRLFLAAIFLLYGLVKFWPGQFGVPTPEIAARNGEGFVMAWSFFGYSRVYEIFIGLGEVLSAILLIIPRTATLGAVCYFPVVLNVMMVNYCFNIGVQDLSTVLAVMCFILLWLDRKKLMLIFWKTEKVDQLLLELEKGERR